MQSPSSSSITAALRPPFHKLLSVADGVVCLPTSPAHSTATLPPLPTITLSPPDSCADALEKHHLHTHAVHLHHDHHGSLLPSPTPSSPSLPQVALAHHRHEHDMPSTSSLSSNTSAPVLSLPSPPSPSVTSGPPSPPDADEKMEILPSPLLWEALCSVVDADEDDAEYDASPVAHGRANGPSHARAVPNDDANRYSPRVEDVGMVDWDHMDQLMGTREYGAW